MTRLKTRHRKRCVCVSDDDWKIKDAEDGDAGGTVQKRYILTLLIIMWVGVCVVPTKRQKFNQP